MKITWYGHSAFRIDHGKSAILIDPFLSKNPSWCGGWEVPAAGVTHVLVSHGHNDHVGDALEILRASGAQLVANYEICMYLSGQGGLEQKQVNPANHGGTVDCSSFTTTLVNAVHSSSENGISLGNPAGLVLHFPDAPTLYHMGDTDIFGDMALINELHRPKIAMVPIGDRFTMGGAVAALACRRFFAFDAIFPCHYGSFAVLDPDAAKFVEAMQAGAGNVRLPKPGESVEI